MFIIVRILHIVLSSVNRIDKFHLPAGKLSSWLSLCTFLFIFLGSSASLGSPIIVIDETIENLSLAQYVDILDDSDQLISPDQILGSSLVNQFSPVDLSDRLALSEYSTNFWLRFSIHNTSSQPLLFWLYANDSSVRDLSVYVINSQGKQANNHEEQAYNLAKDALFQDEYHTPILKEISVPAKSTTTYLAKLNTVNKHTSDFKLIKSDKFLAQQIKTSRLFSFGLGILCFIAFTSLFFALYRKSQVFLYYSCFVLSHIGIEATGIGIPRNWYPNFSEWQYPAIFCFYYLATATGIMGVQHYIKSKNTYTRHFLFLTLAQYFNFFSCLILFLIIDVNSPFILLPIIIAVPVILGAYHYCVVKHNDKIALGLSFVIIFGGIMMASAFFFSDTSFGLHQLITPVMLYAMVIGNTGFCIILIIRELNLIENEYHHKKLIDTSNTKHNAQQELLSEVSHDIRTPISGILGMADLLKLSSLTAKQLEKVDAIKSSGQTLLDKVSEIHYRLQLQKNSASVQKHPFELTLLIETCINSFRVQADTKNIELISHIQSDVPVIVLGDELRLRQIIIKLIENAVKNTNQGEILINVSKLASNPNSIHFSIKDTGRGLTNQELTSLENIDINTDSLNEDKLGIPTTRKLLNQLKSELFISSYLGEGSDFSFSLLLPQAAHTSPDTNRVLHKILASKKLLVVDDNHTCCKVLKQQASSWGMKVTEAYNGNEALAMFRAKINLHEPFDAIIVDYDMPGLSGIEVAERILTETDEPPIMIMLTGLSVAPPDHIAHKAGIATVLTKPSSQKLIRLTLANLFQEQITGHSNMKNSLSNKPLRILVAEDNDVSRGVISKMIENFGTECKLVSNGQLALDAVKRERFDLILMDCKMPLMDGYEASKKIHLWQEDKHQKLTPIIALTAYMPEDHKEEREQAGMQGYLEKPIVMAELEAAIKRHTQKL